jgi:hypothetical protein
MPQTLADVSGHGRSERFRDRGLARREAERPDRRVVHLSGFRREALEEAARRKPAEGRLDVGPAALGGCG